MRFFAGAPRIDVPVLLSLTHRKRYFMISLKDVAAAFLEFKQWPIFATPDPNMICTQFAGHNGQWNSFVQLHPEQPIAIVYSLFPIQCPTEKEAVLLELIARCNSGLMIGNFEYDFDHREVRFKTSLNATHMSEKLEIFDSVFYYNFLAMDQFFPKFKALLTE